MTDTGLPRLRLLQLLSPNLPTGAFTWSQGIEWAVECGWLNSRQSTHDWIKSILDDSLQYLELPLLSRLYTAASHNHHDKFLHWSQWLYASRETFELRNEEKQRARALLTVLEKLPGHQHWPALHDNRQALLSCQLAGYAVAACHWKISLHDLLSAYTWSWLENTVLVAMKLVPLGQSDGQRLLYELSTDIERVIKQIPFIDDNEIGASTPALAIASSLHETQYTRLFRS
ncbi:Urease accessory protein UreF [hydrothermal vent metagenome]|uniref:Urease accessory protein UreF n=1 Tax=hydrothermal vent metagenome TaxID=652676 RepID=A0A3B0X8U1_9ZZZZ